jgi:tetratricopeptide (TPR) repeat protein
MSPLGAPPLIRYDGVMSRDITPPVVVLVHHPDDSAAALALAGTLREKHGIEVWVRGWEVVPGDNIVEMIDGGLARALGGLILLSGRVLTDWERAQYDALVARAEKRRDEGMFVMPVLLGADVKVPPLLESWAPAPCADVSTIARAILKHAGFDLGDAVALGKLLHPPPNVELELVLRRDGAHIVAQIANAEQRSHMPEGEARELRGKLRGAGTTRERRATAGENPLAEIGHQLADVLAGPVAAALSAGLDPRADRGHALLRVRADDPELLTLPWEAAILGDLGALALIPRTTLLRVSSSKAKYRPAEVPGPLRILVAVASPADDLGIEREQEVILDALEARAERERRQQRTVSQFHVAFIDESLATLDALREQLDAEPFHVLHISAHGGPGELLFEDLDGKPAPTTAEQLANLLLEVKHPPSLVVLSACSTAAPGEDVDRLHVAQVLLDAGVPAVIAMQGPVGDGYATELAHHLYRRLALSDAPSPARALADARRDVEHARQDHARRGAHFAAEQPEYGTPVAYAIDELGDHALYDHTRPFQAAPPLPALIEVPGMPERPLGWVVGLRAFTRTVRGELKQRAGFVLTGMGGLGKSSLALRVLSQVVRAGWGVVAKVGTFSLADLAREFLAQLDAQKMPARMSVPGREWFAALRERSDRKADDSNLLEALCGLLTHEPIVLLLDNFEDNLVRQPDQPLVTLAAGAVRSASIREGTREAVEQLAVACRGRGALLITSRYALAGLTLRQHDLPSLNSAAVRRLLFRLPGLQKLPATERAKVLETFGPHPRALEFANALVRIDQGDWDDVFEDIQNKILALTERRNDESPQDLDATPAERLACARRLAAEDVLLHALLATLDADTRRFLVAIAVFRRGVPGDALDAVARAVGLDRDGRWQRHAVRVLQDRTLLTETGPGMRIEAAGPRTWRQSWMVHRWTAAELHTAPNLDLQVAHGAAANWWLTPRQLDWDDALEGLEHLLLAGRFSEASSRGLGLFVYAMEHGLLLSARALCERLLELLPREDSDYAVWLGSSAELCAKFGDSPEAEGRLLEAVLLILGHLTHLPEDASLQRSLSVSYEKLGDLHRALGNTDLAGHFFENSLSIIKHLADAEPDRADLQRDLSVSYNKLGDLNVELGNGEQVREFFEASLSVITRLVEAEPGSADFQRDLACSSERLGYVHRGLRNADLSRGFFEDALAIRKRLVAAEPARADLQRDLAASCSNLGDLHTALGNADQARRLFEDALFVLKRLVDAEPGRVDLQRDLSGSYEKLGDLHRVLGNAHLSRRFFGDSLDVTQRLVDAEPTRADLQRDLAASYERMAIVESDRALPWLSAAVAIRRQRLAAEPASAVVRRELAITLLQYAENAEQDETVNILRESYGLLRDLHRRGALEAQYHALVAQLHQLLGD